LEGLTIAGQMSQASLLAQIGPLIAFTQRGCLLTDF
jgi:hypothetical protein